MSQTPLRAAQALNGQAQVLPYADEQVEAEEEEEAQAKLLPVRKQSLGQRRNVELPHLLVLNERPVEPEMCSLNSGTPTPPAERERERERDHFGPGLRRNSISLPQGINSLDLEALRLRHQMQAQEALHEESQTESVSRGRAGLGERWELGGGERLQSVKLKTHFSRLETCFALTKTTK